MKRNRGKSVFSLLLALCMLILLTPPPAAIEAASGKCGGEVTWNLSADGTLTISGKGDMTSGARKSGLMDKSHDYSFHWPWDKYRDDVRAIVIEEGITSVGTEAFDSCRNAARISLPSTLKTIRALAFYECAFERVTIPQGVTNIEERAFCGCYGLTGVYLPDSVQKIDYAAFDYTILQDVYYGGTQAQWGKVSLYASDRWHKRAEFHYGAAALPAVPEREPVQSTDWQLLMAIFKNTNASAELDGKTYTVKNSLADGEVQRLYKVIDIFRAKLEDSGLVTPHIDIVVLDAPITKLDKGDSGLHPSADDMFSLLEKKGVDLDKYDHVTTFGTLSREIPHRYSGITHQVPVSENPGWSFVEGNNHGKSLEERYLKDEKRMSETAGTMLHEFLHTMEYVSGHAFDLHGVENDFHAYGIEGVGPALDVQLVQNNVKSSHGSGVPAGAWTLPRTKALKAENLRIPEGTAGVSAGYYKNLTGLKTLILPDSAKSIGSSAFMGCGNLKAVYIPASVKEIGYAAFHETGLTDVYYGGSEAQWNKIKFTQDSKGGKYAAWRESAEIHFNSFSSKMPQA